MEQENNKNEADNGAENLAKSQSSEKKSPNFSKAKSDIAKSVAKNFLKTRKATGTAEVWRKKQKKKNKSVSEGSKATENDVKKLNSREENRQKDATTSVEHVEKSEQIQKNEENTHAPDSKKKSSKSNDSPRKRKRGEEPGLSNKNQKNEEKREGKKKGKQNQQEEKHSNSEKNNKNKEKSDGKGKKQVNKTEKVDGLIFMCNAKTKSDCFLYRVMGLSAGKKDLVLGIKRGLKLFLFDYDLKLMYGIYKASSSGGMKLEPKAFGGAFPAQVRFSIHADCYPLAESIFKKAIKENYNEKNRFKTELTARQVRKLTELFRPVGVHSTVLPVHSPSRPVARILEHPENRAHDRPRERPPSDREASSRDPYAGISARRYSVLSYERDRQIPYGELPPTRPEDIHRDLYLTEKEYRAYGLQGERRNLNLQHRIPPIIGSYQRDYGEQLLRQPDMGYSESVPMQRDVIRTSPLYLTEREYDLGATREIQTTVSATANTSVAAASTLDSYTTDPYYSRYLPRPRGEAHLIETDHLRRRESGQVDGVHSTFASDPVAYYNQRHRRQDVKPEAASTSVSSWYSFGGASLSYR